MLGFLLTVVYVALTVLSPAAIWPDLAEYRIMLWLGLAAALASVGSMIRGQSWRLGQSYLMIAFIIAICLSRVLNGWFGGALEALAQFAPIALVFFLIVWNISTPGRLRFLVIELLLIALYFVARGCMDYYGGAAQGAFVYVQHGALDPATGEATKFLRIRALGILNDPNDFAQYLVMLLPFLLPAWRPRRLFRNSIVCLLPAAIVIFGIYLTNSRGGLLATAVVAAFLLADKWGKRWAALFAPAVVAVFLALNQSGRAISLNENSARGRADAWSEGLGMFKHSPLWGVGFGGFTDHHDLTAHNSLVLCLAELGLVGCFVWLGLIVLTVMQVGALGKEPEQKASGAARWALALRLSLYGTLAASWFLSRTYSVTLYIVFGIASALLMIFPKEDGSLKLQEWVAATVAFLCACVLAVYVTVRLRFV